jgi:hypothetical protein
MMVTVDASVHTLLLLKASAEVSATAPGSVNGHTCLPANWMSPGILLPRFYKINKHLVEETEF